MRRFPASSFFRRLVPVVAFLLAACAVQPAQAQTRWLQTAEVITPIEQEGPVQALLDTLVQRIERGQALPMHRTPEEPQVTPAALEEQLFAEGLDYTSANRVFIDYRFEMDRQGFSEKITGMYFIYRPEGIEEADIPILYLDTSDPAVDRLLSESGTTLPDNAAAFRPFREQIGFTRMSAGQTLVAVGDDVIREPERAEAEKRRLVRTIERFSY